jgi:hypothetical protein
MAQRFGRRRKRKLEDRIKYLESVAYGPYGPCPVEVESIDDLRFTSKTIRIDDDPMSGYSVEVNTTVSSLSAQSLERLHDIVVRREYVRLDGRCLLLMAMSPRMSGLMLSEPDVALSFRQVVPPTT